MPPFSETPDMPTHNYITCVVCYLYKLTPNTSPEVQTIYFYQLIVSSSVIKHPYPFLPLSPNIKNLPLQYLEIQILGYSKNEYYLNPCNTTHNQTSTSLYTFHDQKRTGIWKSSIQASISGRENFNLFGLRPQQEIMMIMVTMKKWFCSKIGTTRKNICIYR